MEAQEVIQREAESGGGRAEFKGVVGAMPVIVVEEDWEAFCALVGVGVGVSIGPFAQRGLDEALGLTVGLCGVSGRVKRCLRPREATALRMAWAR